MKLFWALLFPAFTVAAQTPPADSSSDVAEPVAPTASFHSVGLWARSDSADPASGVLLKTIRAKNPAQLINPRAPKEYGDGWDNVSFDIITGQAKGLKLFAIGF